MDTIIKRIKGRYLWGALLVGLVGLNILLRHTGWTGAATVGTFVLIGAVMGRIILRPDKEEGRLDRALNGGIIFCAGFYLALTLLQMWLDGR